VDIRRKSANIVEIGMRINLGNDVLRSQGGTLHLKKKQGGRVDMERPIYV